MAQLTWQNIAAPDFRDTIMAQGQAADLFNKAATSLSGTFNAMGTDRENDRSMAAKAKLLEIQDPEAFKQLMANGGLASLGIDVAKTNDEFQNFANSYGDTLVQRADAERTRQRGFAADARADAELVKSDQMATLSASAFENAMKLAPTTASPEELANLVKNQGMAAGKSAAEIQMDLDAAAKVPPAFWAISEENAGDFKLTPEAMVVNNALTAKQNELQRDQSNNVLGRAYSEGLQGYSGVSDVGLAVVEKLKSKVDPDGAEGETSLFSQSAGSIQTTVNQMVEKYKSRVPPELVAKIVENSITDDGNMLWTGDKLELDISAATEKLDNISSEYSMSALEQQRSGYENDTAKLADIAKDFGAIGKRFEIAKTAGNEDGMAKAMADLDELAKKLSPAELQIVIDRAQKDDAASVEPAPARPTGAEAMLAQAAAAAVGNETPTAVADVAQARAAEVAQSGQAAKESVGNAITNGARTVESWLLSGLGNVANAAGNIDSFLGAESMGAAGFRAADTFRQAAGRYAEEQVARSTPAMEAPVAVAQAAPLDPRTDMTPRRLTPEQQAASLLAQPAVQPELYDTSNDPALLEPPPARPPEPKKDPVVQEAAASPIDAFRAVAAETGMGVRPGSPLNKILTIMETGKDPQTGKDLTKEQRAFYKKQLTSVIKQVRDKYPGAENDPVSRLLANPDAWLK